MIIMAIKNKAMPITAAWPLIYLTPIKGVDETA